MEKILTKQEKKSILKTTIREFRNNFAKYRKVVENGEDLIVCYRNEPILFLTRYSDDILERNKES